MIFFNTETTTNLFPNPGFKIFYSETGRVIPWKLAAHFKLGQLKNVHRKEAEVFLLDVFTWKLLEISFYEKTDTTVLYRKRSGN